MKFERFEKFSRHDQGMNLVSALLRADFWLKDKNETGLKETLKEVYEILEFMKKSSKWSEMSHIPEMFLEEIKSQENSTEIGRYRNFAESV